MIRDAAVAKANADKVTAVLHANADKAVADALEAVGLSRDLLNQQLEDDSLSGGERQRVAIARAVSGPTARQIARRILYP